MTLPSTGTYLLAVAGTSATNTSVSYSFEVFDNVNPTTTLTLGTPVTGDACQPGRRGHLHVHRHAPARRIYFDGLDSASSYLYADLTDPYGNKSSTATCHYSNQGPYTLTYAGTYTLTISTATSTSWAPAATASSWTTRPRQRALP